MNYITKNEELYESLPNFARYHASRGLYHINNVTFKTLFFMDKPMTAKETSELMKELWGIFFLPKSVAHALTKMQNVDYIEKSKTVFASGVTGKRGGHVACYTPTPFFYQTFKQ